METSTQKTSNVPNELFDVLVIGGGIVGAGIARDAAMRGLRTHLIEQNDFASGTSSHSSRLLHGGIRYLAQGRVGLVREANKEKTVVQHIAPHVADPLAFIFPTRRKTQWSKWKLGIGVKIYDLLCGRRNLGKSRILSYDKTLQLLPGLEQTRLTGSVRYYDGLTNDARLVLDTLRSATKAGATVSNYVRYINAERGGEHWECQLEKTRTNEQFTVRAKAVINATGPWSSKVPNSQTCLRLTKGVHLVVDHDRLPVPDAVVVAEGERILFVIPWGERIILGTTDTDYDGPIGKPACNAEDTAYVLDAMNRAFPQAALTTEDVISDWAGLRPLVADRNGDPSDISRRHEIEMSHPGWWDVTGGKLTTYRLMAEETIDAVTRHMGITAAASTTAEVPLLDETDTAEVSGILPPEVTQSAVEHYCAHEWAVHLEDVMIRRTSWHYYFRDRLAIAEQVASWMRDALGWSEDTRNEELRSYRERTQPTAVPAPHMNGETRAARQADLTR